MLRNQTPTQGKCLWSMRQKPSDFIVLARNTQIFSTTASVTSYTSYRKDTRQLSSSVGSSQSGAADDTHIRSTKSPPQYGMKTSYNVSHPNTLNTKREPSLLPPYPLLTNLILFFLVHIHLPTPLPSNLARLSLALSRAALPIVFHALVTSPIPTQNANDDQQSPNCTPNIYDGDDNGISTTTGGTKQIRISRNLAGDFATSIHPNRRCGFATQFYNTILYVGDHLQLGPSDLNFPRKS